MAQKAATAVETDRSKATFYVGASLNDALTCEHKGWRATAFLNIRILFYMAPARRGYPTGHRFPSILAASGGFLL